MFLSDLFDPVIRFHFVFLKLKSKGKLILGFMFLMSNYIVLEVESLRISRLHAVNIWPIGSELNVTDCIYCSTP